MHCLRIGLSWVCCAIRHVYVDAERPHNVHADEAGRRLQAHNDDEAGSTTSFAPLYVKVLSSAGNLQRFAVCTVHSSLELLQGPPLGTVAPPDREPQAGYGGSCIHQTEDRDAFQRESACDVWPYSAPNWGHLGLR